MVAPTFCKAVWVGILWMAALQVGQFWSGAGTVAGHDADDRVIVNTTTGAVYYDADGMNGAAAVQIGVLGTGIHPTPLFSDFFVSS